MTVTAGWEQGGAQGQFSGFYEDQLASQEVVLGQGTPTPELPACGQV